MRRTAKFAAVYVALAAMFLRALLPAGWMPAAQASGAPIMLCTMQGPIQIAPHDRPNKHGMQHSNDVCPFAAAPGLSTPETAAALAAPSILIGHIEQASSHYTVREASRREPQSPRAPPSLA